MKLTKATLLAPLLVLFAMTDAQAQLYKWVAPDGTVSYSDTPPPATVTQVERKSYSSAPSLSDLPYELATAVKNSPVTLYTMPNCAACDSGRKMLTERGIPFSEKTITSSDDIERLRQLNSNAQLPVLAIGRNKQTGFDPGLWGSALTNAGYPGSSKLPSSYSNPAPTPLAPPAVANQSNDDAGKNPEASDQKVITPPPALGNAPPGFQF